MAETAEHRMKRLSMRSWRRGMKEMDLILGGFADQRLAELTETEIAAYERLLDENDQDLYKWVSKAEPTPPRHAPIIMNIAAFHKID